MDNETQKIIDELVEKLPEKTRAIVTSPEIAVKIARMGSDNSLNPEQARTLEIETYLVLLGLTPIEEFDEVIRNKLIIGSDTLELMILDVHNLIFKDLMPELVDLSEPEEGVGENEASVKLEEDFRNLPLEEQTAINNSNYQQTLYDILEAESLSIPQMGDLEELTTSLILGTTPSDKFEGLVKERLNLPEEKTKKLVTEINEKILRKIRANITIPEIQKKTTDADVLGQAGIKIVTKSVDNVFRSNIITPQKNASETLSQKLSQPFQMPKIKTEYSGDTTGKGYSLADLQKTKEIAAPAPNPSPNTTPKMSDIKPSAPKPAPKYQKGVDPYRLSPDE
jgi:hypothetical protein